MNLDELRNIYGECELIQGKVIVKSNLHDIIKFSVNNYSFNMLKSITAIDLGDGLELQYKLYSTENEEEVTLAIKVHDEAETVTDIFDSAVADENEIYDMFGVNFIGNKNLKRLYMPENWEGFPLRKDYVQDDTRLVWNDNSNNA